MTWHSHSGWQSGYVHVNVKKVIYFGAFCYLNGHCIRKSITLMFMSSLRDVILLSLQNKTWLMFLLVSGCHVGAHGHQHCISIHIFGKIISSNILHMKNNCTDLNLSKDLRILNFISFHYPDSGIYLLNSSDLVLFLKVWLWKLAINLYSIIVSKLSRMSEHP